VAHGEIRHTAAQLLGFESGDLFEHVAGLATTAEESGFDSVWVMDHFSNCRPWVGRTNRCSSVHVAWALAARTHRVQLGTLVTGVTYRNPASWPRSSPRWTSSLGAGHPCIGGAWYDVEHQGLGIEYPSDGVRLDMLEEAVQVCRAMFTGDDVSFEGNHYRLDHARNLPRPVQTDGPKIMIGGGGEKRTLRLVASTRHVQRDRRCRHARHKIEVLHRHCAEVGGIPRRLHHMDDPADPDHVRPEHG